MSMFSALSPLSKLEMHRQVVADVHGTSYVLVGVERERRLGALADMMGAAADAAGWQDRVRGQPDPAAGRAGKGHHRARMRDLPSVTREAYDAERPDSAPSAEVLCDEFGGWRRARAAAWTHAGHRAGHAWAPAPYRSEPYSAKSARAALAAFTRANGHLPVDPLAYWAWRRAEIDRAHRAGKPRPDLPDRAALRNALQAGSWPEAVAASGITRAQLDRYRRALMRGGREDEPVGCAAAALAGTADDALLAAGMTADAVALLRSGGPAAVPLTDAVRVAALLDGSLEWLLGSVPHPGSPPSGDEVDGAKVRALRKRQGLSEDDLRRAASMALAPFRRAVRGDGPISLGQVAIIAAHLGCEVSQLIASTD